MSTATMSTADLIALAYRLRDGEHTDEDIVALAAWLPYVCGERDVLATRLARLQAEGRILPPGGSRVEQRGRVGRDGVVRPAQVGFRRRTHVRGVYEEPWRELGK